MAAEGDLTPHPGIFPLVDPTVAVVVTQLQGLVEIARNILHTELLQHFPLKLTLLPERTDLFDESADIPVVFTGAEDVDEGSPGLLGGGARQPVGLPLLAQPAALLGELPLLPGLLELSRAVRQLGRQSVILGQGRLGPTAGQEDPADPAVLWPGEERNEETVSCFSSLLYSNCWLVAGPVERAVSRLRSKNIALTSWRLQRERQTFLLNNRQTGSYGGEGFQAPLII